MATKVLSAARRHAFLRRPWRHAGIPPANPFSLYMKKYFSLVNNLPLYKRASALAKSYAELGPEALAKLKAEAKRNRVLREAYRAKVKTATAYGLFAAENKDLYTNGFQEGSRTVAKMWKTLSDEKKADYAKRADELNLKKERFIQKNTRDF